MIDIVLCFALEERDRIAPWLDALKAEGWRVGRLGVGTKGARLSDDVRGHLRASRLVLVAWTAEGARRPALREAADAARAAGTLLGVRVDPVELPDGATPGVDLTVASAPYTALCEAVRARLAARTGRAGGAASPSAPPGPVAGDPLDDAPDEPTSDEPPRIVPPPPRVGSRAAARAQDRRGGRATPSPPPRVARAVPPPPVRVHMPAPSEPPGAPALPADLEPTSRPRAVRSQRRSAGPLIAGAAVMLVAAVVAAGFLWPHLAPGPRPSRPARITASSTAPPPVAAPAPAQAPAAGPATGGHRLLAARRARLAGGDPEVARLVELGWQEVQRSSWVRAIERFARVDVLSPGHHDAAYGMGFAELHRGRPEDGRRQLCRAMDGVSAVEREAIRAILAERGMACD